MSNESIKKYITGLNPIGGLKAEDTTDCERSKIALFLDLLYRGDGITLDEDNIDLKASSFFNAERLKAMALNINFYKSVIDIENKSYNLPPKRSFMTKTGAKASDEVRALLEKAYEELEIDLNMAAFERQTAYEGTVLVRPIKDLEGWTWLKECPSDSTLRVKTNPQRPSQAIEIEYSYKTRVTPISVKEDGTEVNGEEYDAEVTVSWSKLFVTTTIKKIGTTEVTVNTEPNLYGELPWATSRFISDSRRFWGPVDYSAYSLAITMSFIIADAIMKTQQSFFNILVLGGFTEEEAKSAINTMSNGKVIRYENTMGDTAGTGKKVEFISPSVMEANEISNFLTGLYKFWKSCRGHHSNNFEGDSSLVQSAESQKLAMKAVSDLQESRRPYLTKFEKDIFELIKKEINVTTPNLVPDDVILVIDWAPEQTVFNSTEDRIKYQEYMKANNYYTDIDIMRMENPELSREDAEAKLADNKLKNGNAVKPEVKPVIPDMVSEEDMKKNMNKEML